VCGIIPRRLARFRLSLQCPALPATRAAEIIPPWDGSQFILNDKVVDQGLLGNERLPSNFFSKGPLLKMAIGNLLHAAQVATIEHPLQSLAVAFFVIPILYVLANEVIRGQARVVGLGGPTGFPLIGNLWQIRKNAAEKYRQWARTYGAVYQIQLGNIPVVVVNSAASAKILFGQNAQALSSRPEFYTFHKVRSN